MKTILTLLLFLFCFPAFSQLTDTEKKELYPEKYSFDHYDKFMNESAYDKAMWILVNLYPENREKVIEKVKIIKEKIDTTDLRMFIVSSFSTYVLFDPTVVNWDNNMPEINNEMMNLKGSWGDAIIAEFYPEDPLRKENIIFATKNGYMLAFNYEYSKFTVRVEGKEVKPMENQFMFLADNRALQINAVELIHFPKLTEAKNLKDSLQVFMNNEIEYYNDLLKTKLKATDNEIIKIGKQKYLLWSYTLPADLKAELDKQYFLTTIIGDRYFILATAENKSVKTKEIKKYMSNYASTLKIYGKEMDIKQIEEGLKNE